MWEVVLVMKLQTGLCQSGPLWIRSCRVKPRPALPNRDV